MKSSPVALLPLLALVSANQNFLYYTSDDGPNAGTPFVLDAAKNQNVTVSFFVNGHNMDAQRWGQINVDNNVKYVERIVTEGHSLADHSYDHMSHNSKDGFATAADSYQTIEDLKWFGRRNSGAFAKYLRVSTVKKLLPTTLYMLENYVRMPFVNTWRVKMSNGREDIIRDCLACVAPASASKLAVKIADKLYQNDVQVFGWDLEWVASWGQGLALTGEEFMAKVDQMADGYDRSIDGRTKIVILNHDHGFIGTPQAQKELETFFALAKKAGYIFRPIDKYHSD